MRHFFLLVSLLTTLTVTAQLRINELMTNNVSFHLDESFNYSMWVEVYNAASENVQASDYWFSNKLNNPCKWKPADTTLFAGGYHLFYFERSDRPGHASFKLDPEGGTLYLFSKTGQLIDSMSYPAQIRNISYGRIKEETPGNAFFVLPTPGARNNAASASNVRCAPPIPSLKGGFYASTQKLRFQCDAGDTVYYTTDCSEPTRQSNRFYLLSPLTISSTSVIRARTFSKGKIPGPMVTNTYFINVRDHQLPVVSLATTQANLTDPKTGIYCEGDGTNGGLSRYETVRRNYYADWNRPVNFELYDSAMVQCINQEVDTKILGGWTRKQAAKSLAISPKKKFGSSRLAYDFFKASKPDYKYKDIQVRNSGNDFAYSMFRDGLMQTIVRDCLPALDYMAYEPAVLYLNGQYWGIENLRERSNEDWIYSNYGFDEDEVYTIEGTKDQDTEKDMATDTAFIRLCTYLKNNDPAQAEVYAEICRRIDTDNFMAYMIAELYTSNSDWPDNNVKMWRQLPDGQWHWLLSDLDFGMSLYSSNEATNMLAVALGESGDRPEWSTLVFKKLMQNPVFLNTFIDRFTVHLSTTFAKDRVNQLIDSLSAKIASEITYHKARFGSSRGFAADLALMKVFAAARPGNVLNFLSNRFLNATPQRKIQLSSSLGAVQFRMNNELISSGNASIQAFKGRTYKLEALPPKGYVFSHWTKSYQGYEDTIFDKGSEWRYFDGASLPATSWMLPEYKDQDWKTGAAPLGYGNKGEVTTLGYGGNASAKYPTAYFRAHFTITDLSKQTNFRVSVLADDGAAVYINGKEAGRLNLPTSSLTYATYTISSNNGVAATYSIPASYLRTGDNVIAVEVHQCNATSSDLLFDLNIACDKTDITPVVRLNQPVLSETLDRPVALEAFFTRSADTLSTSGNILINEVLPANTQIPDEFGEKDDAIELYNTSDAAVDLTGWFLSDDPSDLKKGPIKNLSNGSTQIPAKGFLVCWADDTPVQGPLHLPFKLSATGEVVLLSRTVGSSVVCVDSVRFANLGANESWSRITDASPFWKVHPPTLGVSNGEAQTVPEVRENSGSSVWPSLFTEEVHILCSDAQNIVLTDMNGRNWIQYKATSEETVLKTGSLPAGLYFLRAGTRVYKLIKH